MTGNELILLVGLAVYCLCATALFLYGLNCYVMIWLFSRARQRQESEDRQLLERFRREYGDEDLPPVTVQLPVFNERFVIRATRSRLIKLFHNFIREYTSLSKCEVWPWIKW